MRLKRICVATALAALAWPSAAHAAALDHRAGEQPDAVGDATVAHGSGSDVGARLLDIQRARVDYDAGSGALNLSFEGDSLYNTTHAVISFSANIGAPNPSTGRCDKTVRPGDVTVAASGTLGYDMTEDAYLSDKLGRVAKGSVAWPGDGSTPHIAFNAMNLAEREWRCVSNVHGTRASSGFENSSRDDVADFCLGDCPGDPVAPTVSATGAALSWNQVNGAGSYVVATSTDPEGAPGRSTTYVTVSGTTYTPPTAPGVTRYYAVRANVDRAPWSRPETSIVYPKAADPAPGGQDEPAAEKPQTPHQPVQTHTNPHGQTMTVITRPLTAARSRSIARRALANRYGKAYERRARGGDSIACTPVGAKAICAVQWRYRGSRYKGTIVVVHTQGSDSWRTAIRRTRMSLR